MTELNISIIAQSDDAEERYAPAEPNITSTALDFRQPTNDYVGLRFQNVTIPPGSTIISAIVRMTSEITDGGASSPQNIYCEDIDDAPTFTEVSGNVSTRTQTTAFVLWTPGAVVAASQYDTADFTAALQEVIDRPGWASGQDVVILFVGIGAADDKRVFWSFDHGSNVPQIRIAYSVAEQGYVWMF